MSRRRLHSKTCAITFSLLIVLSSLAVVNLPLETVGAESTRGEGDTWYVDDDAADGGEGSLDKPYQKIQDGIDASENGDTIQVFNGTYYENVNVNKVLNLIGNGSETTTIDGEGSGDVVKIVADWVNMSGFMVTGSGGSSNSGIKVESDHNHIFDNNVNNNDAGIYLRDSSDTTITNNTCSNNYYGIRLSDSNDNTLINNTANNNMSGIRLYSSDENTLINNTANNNNWYGIDLSSSDENTLTNNTANNNEYGAYINVAKSNVLVRNNFLNNTVSGIHIRYNSEQNEVTDNIISDNNEGIYLSESYNNELIGNTISNNNESGISLSSSSQNTIAMNHMVENGISIEGDSLEHFNTHAIDANNTVNGKPVYYYKNTGGITVPSGAGQIIIANSINMVIENQNLNNGSIGILAAYSSDITIQNNTCSNNSKSGIIGGPDSISINNTSSNNGESGIIGGANSIYINNTSSNNGESGIIGGSYSIISNNTLSNNTYGISLSSSSHNTLSKNIMVENGISIKGDSLEHYNTHNIDKTNTVNGKFVYYFANTTGITVPANAGQVIIANCTSMVVEDQDLNNGSVGIIVGYSSKITIHNNTSSNNKYGIILSNSGFNTITNNTCSNNDYYGIDLSNSDDSTIANNTASNNLYGIYLYYSDDSTITNNTFSNNNGHGIYLSNSDFNTITNNTCSNNRGDGIYLSYSDYNIITNNNCSNNDDGISLLSSEYNTFTNNTFSNNNKHGIYLLYYIAYNTFTKNRANSNGESGIYLRGSYNTFTKNIYSYNTIGIHFNYDSDENIITHSTISGNEGGILMERSSSDNTVQYNNIFNNRDYAINASNNEGFNVDATNNWWGDTSGPYHPVNNSVGKGDNVTDYVDFDPWVSEKLFRSLVVTKSGNDTTGNGTEENPFLSIQKAVDNSNDWDTIRVYEGVYEENVVVDKSVEIIGNGSGETVIQGFAEGDDEEYTVNLSYKGGFGGVYSGIVYEDGYLYAAHFQGLSIFNVSDSSNPEEIGFIPTSGVASSVAVSGGYAFVADKDNGLIVVNVSDPGNLTEVGHYDTERALGLAVIEDYAYVADYSNGLVIIDISDPGNPMEVGLYATGFAHDVEVSGDYAYIAEGSNGLVIVDISDPTNPQYMGGFDTAGGARDIVLNDDFAYIADDDNGLVIVNISDPESPTEEGHYDTAGAAYGVEVSGEYAYVADYSNDLVIVNISDKENPKEVGHHDTEGTARDVAVNGGYAYVAYYHRGLVIVDISDKKNLMEVGLYATVGFANDVEVSGDYAYVADYDNGLVIVDISDSENPTEVGYYDTERALGLAVIEDYVFVADSNNGLVIVDISDPANPTRVGHSNTGDARGVVVRGDYAYVANGVNGLHIVNISDHSEPVIVGRYNTNGHSRGVVVSGDFAYVADGSNGLVIINISDPGNPTEEGHYDTAGTANDVEVMGGYAYVAILSNGLVVVDISDPTNPQYTGGYGTAGSSYGVSVSGGYVYIADSSNGLVIVDISDPANPTKVGYYDTDHAAWGVAVNNEYAYVADAWNGLVIIELHFPPDVALHISADKVRITDLTITNGSRTGILVDADDVEIDHCEITGNIYGIKAVNGSKNIKIYDCNLFDNSAMGMNAWENEDTTVNALNNWWGHPSGPYHPTVNPDGMGNGVSDDINFEPWLSRPIDFRILHVSSDGSDLTGNGNKDNPFGTIQKAIVMAQDWDTIEVAPGTYSESITVNKRNVTIMGDDPETTILDADGAATTFIVTADNVELNRFTIKNGDDNGILMIDSSGNRIVNCIFPDNSYDLNLTNSKNIQLINTTFETVNFNDPISSFSVLWPIDMKVTDNRSGFIPNAHLKLSDTFGTTVFDGYTDDTGFIPQINVLEYYQNLSSRIEFIPCTISVWKDGYLYSSDEYSITSYTRLTYQLQTHILPVAIISGEIIQEVNMDSMIFFDGTESTGRSIGYIWDFGDGKFSTSPTPSHTYTIPGAYQVDLTVTDDYENTSTTSIIVIVENVDPTAQAETSSNTAFEEEDILFDASNSWDTPSDIISYLWDFGDGTQSPYGALFHAYQEEGDYEVRLTVMDMFGGESTTNLYITITNIEPWIIATNVTGMHFPGKPLHFSVTADDTAGDVPSLQYSWDFGDGTIAHEQNVTHVFLEAGIFDVEVTVTDNNGASDSASIQITITDPDITTFVSSSLISQDESVIFNASHELDDGSFVYTWYFGDGTTAMEQETSHIYSMSGTFTPWLMINDGTKNTTIILQEIIVSNVVPVPNIISDKLSVSEDESVHFDASPTSDSPTDLPNLIYTWDFGDGSKGVGIDVTHAFSERGNYTVILTVSDVKATRTTEVEIEVLNLPPMADAGTPKVRKATMGAPVILDASGTTETPSDVADLNFTWKIGSDMVYGKVVSYTFVTTGEFTVTLTVRDNDGATSEDTLTFEVSKSSESEEKETMSTISWILVVLMIVLLVVIGFLISSIRDEALYKEMKALEEAEEAIEVEEVIDEESFKPQDDVQEVAVDVDEVQGGKISDAEIEEGEGKMGGSPTRDEKAAEENQESIRPERGGEGDGKAEGNAQVTNEQEGAQQQAPQQPLSPLPTQPPQQQPQQSISPPTQPPQQAPTHQSVQSQNPQPDE